MTCSIRFIVHEREYEALRAAADTLYGGSVAELCRDALRHRGFAIRTIAAELARQGCSCTYQNVWHFIRKQLGY